MTIRTRLQKILAPEDLNFLLTNRIPRLAATHFVGWLSHIRSPLLARCLIGPWRWFSGLDLSEARNTRFDSLHDCFIRELKPGLRPLDPDPDVMVSPCDGIVGAFGEVKEGQVFQAKGFPYTLTDLLGDKAHNSPWQDGVYLTIRITSAMYHRFHAPADLRMHRVDYFNGDTWNVNPIALKRVEKLFCKNERALLSVEVGAAAHPVALVPVAAILVASIRLHAIDTVLHTRYTGPHTIACEARYEKGQEMGWFEHGSTILVFAPKGFSFAPSVQEGTQIRMGQALLRMPPSPQAPL